MNLVCVHLRWIANRAIITPVLNIKSFSLMEDVYPFVVLAAVVKSHPTREEKKRSSGCRPARQLMDIRGGKSRAYVFLIKHGAAACSRCDATTVSSGRTDGTACKLRYSNWSARRLGLVTWNFLFFSEMTLFWSGYDAHLKIRGLRKIEEVF